MPKLYPKIKLMQNPCSRYNTFCNLTSPTGLLSMHMETQLGNSHAAIPLRSATQDSKWPLNCAHKSATTTAWSHSSTAARKKHANDRSRTRRIPEVPVIAGRNHFTRRNTRFRAQTISRNKAHATPMQPLQYLF